MLGITTHQADQSNMSEGVDVLLAVTFGSSAVASYIGNGFTSVVRNSTGNYTVTCTQTFRKILGFTPGWLRASGAELGLVIVSSTFDSDGKFVLEARNSSGTATDPATGDVLYLRLFVSNSMLNEKLGG